MKSFVLLTLNPWIIGLIVLLIALAIYLVVAVIFYFVAQKKWKKVEIELKKLDEFDLSKGKLLLELVDKLIEYNCAFDDESLDIIRKGVEDIDSLTSDGRARYISIIDFLIVYLDKIKKEDKTRSRYIDKEKLDKLHELRNSSEETYKVYNKAATTYNVFANMVGVHMIGRITRRKVETAIIF